MTQGGPMVALVLLAAGESSRMGEPKQLLRLSGRTLLRRAAEQAIGSACRPVVVVLGAGAERLAREVDDLPVRLLVNDAWSEGMGSSIRAGVAAIQEPVDAALIALCDQPLVGAAHFDAIVRAYCETRAAVVAAEYADTLGPPALFDRTLFPALLAIEGRCGAKSLIAAHERVVVRLPLPEAAADVDTPDEFERIRASLEE